MTRWAILTGEYPPQPGGVSDYTRLIAAGLAAAGDFVTVYSPAYEHRETVALSEAANDIGVSVHRLPDYFGPRGLLQLDRELHVKPRPDRILIQYVPHAYGWRAMNVPFTVWVAARAAQIAPTWVMFHEVAFPFAWRPSAHALLGCVTGLMARLIAGAARRIFVSIPAWGRTVRRICPRAVPTEWLPIPCVVPTGTTAEAVARVRHTYAPDPSTKLIGHFGTFGSLITDILTPTVRQLFDRVPEIRFLLLGRGSDSYRNQLIAGHPGLAARVAASGELLPKDIPAHLRACDLLLQPYVDGISSRRTTVMAGIANDVPVVTNLGPLSEPVWSDSAGVVVALSPDPTTLAARAEAVLHLSPVALAELVGRANALYRETFALEHTITRLRTPWPHATSP